MAIPIAVQYLHSGFTYDLANVSGVSFTYGRQNIIDDYSGLTATISGFSPQWTVKPAIGDYIAINYQPYWTVGGFVSDVTVTYGQTTSMDSYVIQMEGPLVKFGRIYGSITTTAAASTWNMAMSIKTLTTDIRVVGTSSDYGSTTSAQTLTETANDMVQLFLRTEGGWVSEEGPYAYLYGRNLASNLYWDFTDVLGDGKNKYAEVTFRSAADNYSSKVVVQPEGLADQTAGTGLYPIQVGTISGSTSEAANLAGYYFTQLDLNQQVPFALSWTSSIANVDGPGAVHPGYTGAQVRVRLRGTTYNCIVIGGEFTSSNSEWRSTIYLVSSLAQAFLVLDSTTLGVLDTNKLGF